VATNIRFLNPETLTKPPGYTQVVEANGPGRTVYLAGQLGLDLDNKLVGAPGDFGAQCTQAFENLRLALAVVGADFKDVVRVNNYLTDIGYIATLREVRGKYLDPARLPASTTIAISSLARSGALFEIDAIAVLPAKAAGKSARPRSAKRKVKRATRKRR
jgi:enamine deaminase RidA (YjgF/YER057c/UK114 family)